MPGLVKPVPMGGEKSSRRSYHGAKRGGEDCEGGN